MLGRNPQTIVISSWLPNVYMQIPLFEFNKVLQCALAETPFNPASHHSGEEEDNSSVELATTI